LYFHKLSTLLSFQFLLFFSYTKQSIKSLLFLTSFSLLIFSLTFFSLFTFSLQPSIVLESSHSNSIDLTRTFFHSQNRSRSRSHSNQYRARSNSQNRSHSNSIDLPSHTIALWIANSYASLTLNRFRFHSHTHSPFHFEGSIKAHWTLNQAQCYESQLSHVINQAQVLILFSNLFIFSNDS
jgi:hypothetical protein